jgi:hypothetical protein
LLLFAKRSAFLLFVARGRPTNPARWSFFEKKNQKTSIHYVAVPGKSVTAPPLTT